MSEPKHRTIKIWHSTYRTLKRLAGEQPEALVILLDRLVQEEVARRSVDRSVQADTPADEGTHEGTEGK
jgi:hypothetical protein